MQFDYIFGMDEDNMEDLKSMTPDNSKASVELLGDYDPQEVRIIRDPYYVSTFLHLYIMSTEAFLVHRTGETRASKTATSSA